MGQRTLFDSTKFSTGSPPREGLTANWVGRRTSRDGPFIQFAVRPRRRHADGAGPRPAAATWSACTSARHRRVRPTSASKERLAGGPRRISPFFIPSATRHWPLGVGAIARARAGQSATCPTCTTRPRVGDSFGSSSAGDADVMIAGGPKPPSRRGRRRFCAMRALSKRTTIRPTLAAFDRDGRLRDGRGLRDRDLEELEHARRRDARSMRVVGYGCRATRSTIPRGENGAGAYQAGDAPEGCRREPSASNNQRARHLHPVGERWRWGDQARLRAHARNLALSSTKSMTGNC